MAQEKKLTLTLSSDTDIKALETLLTTGEVEILLSSTNPKLNGKPIAVTSIEEVKDVDFCATPQGPALNTLHGIIMDKKYQGKFDSWEFDSYNQATVIKSGKLTLTLLNSKEIGGLRTSTNQLLEALMAKWNANKSNYNVALPLDEYMQLRGINDKKFARKQIKEDLATLYNLSMKFGNVDEAKPKKPNSIDPVNFETRILSAQGIKNSIICVSFSPAFIELMRLSPIMWLPVLAWRLSAKFELNAHYFLHKLALQKRMNAGKENDDAFLAETILKSSPRLPSYEEVAKSRNRGVTRQIYEPLEKGLDALDEFLTWEYRDGSQPIGRDTAKSFRYDYYAKLRIIIHWKKEPLDGWRAQLEESNG